MTYQVLLHSVAELKLFASGDAVVTIQNAFEGGLGTRAFAVDEGFLGKHNWLIARLVFEGDTRIMGTSEFVLFTRGD